MPELRANFFDCVQGSPEWLKLRAGCFTSSRAADGTSRLKRRSNGKEVGDETQARADYKLELVAERLTGIASDHYVSRWMKEGKEKEPLARAAYEMHIGGMVDQIGFILHPEINYCGASPDSLVGDEGLAEYKCPMVKTHLEYLFADVIPKEYEPQMLLQMACDPERKWNDFVSHCPELPAQYRTFIKRMTRDDKQIAEMEKEIRLFLAEVDELMERLQEVVGGESVTERKLKQSIAIARGVGPQLITKALHITEEDTWQR